MHTIAIVSQKGGAPGRRPWRSISPPRPRAGLAILVIDTDPQATASRWSQWRGGPRSRGHRLRRPLPAQRQDRKTRTPGRRAGGLPDWIDAHVRAFVYFGGAPRLLVPDNPKVAIIKPCFYDPEVNRTNG